MIAAARVVDLETPAQRIQIDLSAREALSCQGDRVDRPTRGDQLLADKLQLEVEELEVELGVVDHQRVRADEGDEFLGDVGEPGLVGEKGRGQAMNALRLLGHIALGIEVALKDGARRQVMLQLHRRQLDDAVAAMRVQARGLGIENDLTQSRGPLFAVRPPFASSARGRSAGAHDRYSPWRDRFER